MSAAPPGKWRPTISMITAAVIATVLVLPLVGLLFFRLFENQLIRQTEGELIAQAAMLAAVYAEAVSAAPDALPVGAARPPSDPAVIIDEHYAPIVPTLDLASSPILAARAGATPAAIAPSATSLSLGARLTAITEATQRTTLAGFRLLDANGVVIGGREDIGGSFAHLQEVRDALNGRFRAVLRMRNADTPAPPIYSISRGTKIRVFVALPVFVADRVRGVVYLSRTPDNILRQLYRERSKVAAALALALAAALAIGIVFVRTIARPMLELAERAEDVTHGRTALIGPLRRHGTRELASLTQSFMTMTRRLQDRSNYLSGFASHVSHELKTPLTAIRGAAELMRDAEVSMTPQQRERFLSNVLADVERISALLDRLREMARADNPELGGSVVLPDVVAALRLRFPDLSITLTADAGLAAPVSEENAMIVFGHLADNAQRHGAKNLSLEARLEEHALHISVRDDGAGISEGNRDQVFEPFFTTRRDEGGTGMGLGIVRALLRAHRGDIELEPSTSGAVFALRLPVATAS